MAKSKKKIQQQKQDEHQVSVFISVCSILGLAACVIVSFFQDKEVSIWLYAIFGGGVLGTDNIIKLAKSILRIDR